MCKRLVYIMLLILTLAVASVHGGLAHYWKLDDSGTIAVDSAGGLNGVIRGGPTPIEGKVGAALSFDGADDVIEISNFTPPPQGTVAFWINSPLTMTTSIQRVMGVGGNYETWIGDTGDVANEFFDNGSYGVFVEGVLKPNEWIHLVQTYDSATAAMEIYINGVLALASEAQTLSTPSGRTLLIGHRAGAADNQRFEGILDDVRIYDEVLSAEQIRSVFGVDPIATSPFPEDGAMDVPRETALSWSPGEVASSHDVYLGIGFDDVNDAGRNNPLDVLVSQAQDPAAYKPSVSLDFGQVYYWRIDEVNAPPDSTIFKGQVWSFKTEPYAHTIENIIATSNGGSEAGEGPENTVDGSGLNEADQHSTEKTDMWLATAADEPLRIQFEFGRLYKLHELLVWNHNTDFEDLLGFGLKDINIECSANGTDWTALGEVTLNQATADATYGGNTTVPLGGVAAKYVRLNVISAYGETGQYGLSEVRFSYISTYAREPDPPSGASDVDVKTTLGWRAGSDATAHDVYFGTDAEVLALVESVADSQYSPGDLYLGNTYYWRIDEVNETQMHTTWQGDIWSFSTPEYIIVDDFESYNDIDPPDPESHRIFEAWVDGFGVQTNGALAGNDLPPYAEQTIVYGGRQSMPLSYSNTGGATYSEVEHTLAVPQDWTMHGIKTLVLYFYGSLVSSGGQVYVKINDTKVLYDGDAINLSRPLWTLWAIDLASTGANLNSVSKLTIGIDGDGEAGTIYVDDIGLYAVPGVPTEQIWIEAEAATTITAPLEIISNSPDASGGQYVGSLDAGLSRSDGPGDDGTGFATYTFTVRGGTYRIRAREIVPNGQADSWWVRIQGATLDTNIHANGWIQWNGQPVGQDWAWNDIYSSNAGGRIVLFTMPAGTYTLDMAYREDGCLLDALVITAD